MDLWNFSAEELLGIHQPDLKGVLCLDDFKKLHNQYLHSRAHHTLGYELWLRNVQSDLQKGLFSTVRDTIHIKQLLAILDTLGREVGDAISLMVDNEDSGNNNPPQPIQQALLIRTRNKLQAEEVVRLAETAEVALGEVVPSKLNPAGRQILADTYRSRAARSYLPAIKKYYGQRAKYLDHLVHSPGTPFYPGRPPKRKYGSAWYPAGRPRKDPVAGVPWRPIYRPWIDESECAPETSSWADLERRVAERSRKSTDGKRSPRPNDQVLIPKPGPNYVSMESGDRSHLNEPSKPVSSQLTLPNVGAADDEQPSIEEQADHAEAEASQVATREMKDVNATVAHNPHDLSKALLVFALSQSERGKQETRHSSAIDAPTAIPEATATPNPDLSEDDTEAEPDLSEDDTEPEGSDESCSEEDDKFGLSPVRKKPVKSSPLPQQGTYVPPPPVVRLRKRNGGSDWQRHYDALCRHLDDARDNDYWNRMQEPAVAQAVSEIAAECRALAPAAAAVLATDPRKLKKHTLGYGDWEFAKEFARQFFKIRAEVEKARSFIWRSADDYALGIVKRRGKDVGVV